MEAHDDASPAAIEHLVRQAHCSWASVQLLPAHCPTAMATARLNHAAPPQPLGAACKGPRRLPRPPAALQADAGGPPQERVAALVRQQGGGATLYATGAPGEALAAAVADLVATNASQRPAPDSLTAGQGTWEVGPVICWVGTAVVSQFRLRAATRCSPAAPACPCTPLQVFHAPHIARLSSLLGARFQPIRYTLRGNELISNVGCHQATCCGGCSAVCVYKDARVPVLQHAESLQLAGAGAKLQSRSAYSSHSPLLSETENAHASPTHLPACLQVHYEHPLLGAGWLSASGTLEAADDATLVINFNRFWWDLGPLRAELPSSSSSGSQGSSSGSQGSGCNALLDSIVGALGRASFLPQFARFPVQQLDGQAGLAVFRFPPLASSIAVARCSSSPSTSSASGSSADGSLPVA